MPRHVAIVFDFSAQKWWASSPHAPGLMASGDTLPEALRATAKALDDLAQAFVWEAAEGRQPAPIFKGR